MRFPTRQDGVENRSKVYCSKPIFSIQNNTSSSKKEMRIDRMIKKMLYSFTKFSQLILEENVWRLVWRLKGLTYNHLSHVGDIDVYIQAMRWK